MAHLIDKEVVAAEIERIRTYYERLQMIKQVYNSNIDNCNDLLDFLDTLEVKKVQEEPVSEDLEIAANEWDAKASFTPFYMALDDNGNPYEVRQDYTTHAESFKAGAKWQKEQDKETIELAEDHAMLVGMNKMEEQIMNKAKSGIGDKDNYIKFEDDTWLDLEPTMKLKPAFDVKEGDKVKVIVIKED